MSRLLEKAHAGEEIVLAKAGKPYARLVPLERPKRKLGFVEGRVDDSFFEPPSWLTTPAPCVVCRPKSWR